MFNFKFKKRDDQVDIETDADPPTLADIKRQAREATNKTYKKEIYCAIRDKLLDQYGIKRGDKRGFGGVEFFAEKLLVDAIVREMAEGLGLLDRDG